jgi:hypothetical protein
MTFDFGFGQPIEDTKFINLDFKVVDTTIYTTEFNKSIYGYVNTEKTFDIGTITYDGIIEGDNDKLTISTNDNTIALDENNNLTKTYTFGSTPDMTTIETSVAASIRKYR